MGKCATCSEVNYNLDGQTDQCPVCLAGGIDPYVDQLKTEILSLQAELEHAQETPNVAFQCPACGKKTTATLLTYHIGADPHLPSLWCHACNTRWKITLTKVPQ